MCVNILPRRAFYHCRRPNCRQCSISINEWFTGCRLNDRVPDPNPGMPEACIASLPWGRSAGSASKAEMSLCLERGHTDENGADARFPGCAGPLKGRVRSKRLSSVSNVYGDEDGRDSDTEQLARATR